MKNQAKNILIVDDNRDILEALELLLEDTGYKVTAVDNGEYVENLKEDQLPDIILLDMLLSGRDGKEIIALLKNNDLTKDIPIILNSAHPQAKNMWKKAGRKGGIATASSHGEDFYAKIGKKGGKVSGGNFARNPERAKEAGRKGGQRKKISVIDFFLFGD